MIAGIPFIITVILTLLQLIKANKNEAYVEECKSLDKELYPFKDIMSIGLYHADRIGIEPFKEKNRNLYEKMVAIYGLQIDEYFRLHIANKIILAILAVNAVYFVVLANGTINLFMVLVGIVAGVGTYFFADSLQEEQFRNRSKQIRYDFPEFLTKLTLLINAGLTLERAWEKILQDSKGSNSPLIHEMQKTFNDMKNNIPRAKCLNDLSRRCKVKEISKFTSVLLQNMSKGSSDMVSMLQQLSDECWDERKSMAKQKGEEASTKLLFPMMLMLLTVFMIVLVPAMMQMFSL